MSVTESPLVTSLRQEIDRKHQEAIQALETISGYLAAAPAASITKQSATIEPAVNNPPGQSNVEQVYSALTHNDYKTVDQIHHVTGLPEDKIRGVLYSKAADKRVNRKKHGKKMGFKLKSLTVRPSEPTSNGAVENVPSLIRDLLAKHPSGLTKDEILDKATDELKRIGGDKQAMVLSLSSMKHRGKLIRDEVSGAYRLADTD